MRNLIAIGLTLFLNQLAFGQNTNAEKIKTRWAAEVSPTNVWKNYPRLCSALQSRVNS
ncbi:MAG: hypothetical protein H7325_01090 [Pedobacter sp.]|nr:hypothetical protein [Pedobacter sp.]